MAKTQNEIIPIFFAVDDKYVPVLHVAINSLVSQASDKFNYNIHILHEGLTSDNQASFSCFNKENVKIILNNITEVMGDNAKKMHARYYARAAYFRIFIPDMFPEYNKAIYLDSDVCLNSDISELYNIDIGNNYLGAANCETVGKHPVFSSYAEHFLEIKCGKYFNTGILLLNCDVLRKVNFIEKFYDILDKIKLEICPDQDYYNIVSYGKATIIPQGWNKVPLPNSTEKLSDIKLVHYNLSLKPWRYNGILYEELFWKYAKDTVFYDKIIRDKARVLNIDKIKDKNRMENLVRMAKALAKSPRTLRVHISGKSLDRMAVQDRIIEYEKKGIFDADVEDDPPAKPLDYRKFDFTNKKALNKLKARFATYCGRKYYEKMVKTKAIVIGEPKGLENLDGFTGGAVITCNHIHTTDNYVILMGLKKVFGNFRFWKIVKDTNWSHKGVVGLMLRHANTVPISTTNPRLMVECIKAARTILQNGDKMVVYPEQAMWWNYRKPRPLKDGAFMIAAKAGVPIIPCFITMKDTDIIGKDGFPVQEYTLNVMPVIPAGKDVAAMRELNTKLWEKCCNDTYKGKA